MSGAAYEAATKKQPLCVQCSLRDRFFADSLSFTKRRLFIFTELRQCYSVSQLHEKISLSSGIKKERAEIRFYKVVTKNHSFMFFKRRALSPFLLSASFKSLLMRATIHIDDYYTEACILWKCVHNNTCNNIFILMKQKGNIRCKLKLINVLFSNNKSLDMMSYIIMLGRLWNLVIWQDGMKKNQKWTETLVLLSKRCLQEMFTER